jgi:hypothetical protein
MKFSNIPILSWELIDPDAPEKNIGHSVRIPNRCMDEILYHFNSDTPMCIELRSMADPSFQCVIFGNIEVGEDEIVVVPYWALSKLRLEPFSMVSLENVDTVRKAGFIKVRATHSSYVYWDGLKETLETEFSKINYISVGDPVNVFGVEFHVLELRDTEGVGMLDGCLFNADIEIDFETPMDIEEQERAELVRIEEEKRLQKEEEEKEKMAEEEKRRAEAEHKNRHFIGKGYRINDEAGGSASRIITREERAQMFQKLFEKQRLEKLEQDDNQKK